ncbi:solute carrier family 22 member 7-like isoform X2 [Alosa alosa]|uniref:solute carrier family 22 member 7-like isoform X2 n=1 Tax=Alosa alosa TaxID=278164 RepID=UPI0020152497|nr:solute carrier family 22 member 7-like isoform X2 [Alosa alosa]
MKFEDLLSEIDGFGRFQKMVLCLSFLGRVIVPCHFLVNNFIAGIPSHHCDISGAVGDFGNMSEEERQLVMIPMEADGKLSSCLMFPEPRFHMLLNSSSSTGHPAEPCRNGWVYDNSTFTSTLATEWDLVCDKKGLNKATATIFFVGVMFGAMTFSGLSDRYGRRKMLLVSYVSGMVFALLSAFSTSYVMFTVLRDWRWLIAAITAPVVMGIISWRWVPESARWLIANGQLDEAHYYLNKCIKMNRRQEMASSIKPENLSNIVLTNRRNRKYSYLDLLRTSKMRKLALLTGLTWYGVAFIFYGIGLNITGFGMNIYLIQFILAAVEIPAKAAIFYLLDKIGRRKTECGALVLTGICLAITVFVPREQRVVRTVVAVLAKGCSAAAFATLILYSSELYPTVMRQHGMGYNSFMGRAGAAVAPLILLLDDVWLGLPQLILCCIAVGSSVVASRLPETRDQCLPEIIKDIKGTRAPQVESPVLSHGNAETEVGASNLEDENN